MISSARRDILAVGGAKPSAENEYERVAGTQKTRAFAHTADTGAIHLSRSPVDAGRHRGAPCRRLRHRVGAQGDRAQSVFAQRGGIRHRVRPPRQLSRVAGVRRLGAQDAHRRRAGEQIHHRAPLEGAHRKAVLALGQAFPRARQEHLVRQRMEQDGQLRRILQHRSRGRRHRTGQADRVRLQQVRRGQKTPQDSKAPCLALSVHPAQSTLLPRCLQRKMEKYRALQTGQDNGHPHDGRAGDAAAITAGVRKRDRLQAIRDVPAVHVYGHARNGGVRRRSRYCGSDRRLVRRQRAHFKIGRQAESHRQGQSICHEILGNAVSQPRRGAVAGVAAPRDR